MRKNKVDSEEHEELMILPNPVLSASNDLGITQEYKGNRSELWDSTKSKQEYRDAVFGDKNTIRDENGNLLHKSHTAAKNKYHQKDSTGKKVSTAWADHAAEVDHKVSLQSLHSHAKHNPFLTDADLKEIANGKENYQILSKSQNASKGADVSAGLKTHAVLQTKFAARTVKNVSTEFSKGAMESVDAAAALSIAANSLHQLIVEGESLEDTAVSAAKSVATIAVTGGAEKIMIDAATHIFANSGNQILQHIVEMNGVGQLLVLGASVGKSIVKYMDGTISAEELAEEVKLTGVTLAISTIVTIAIPVPFLGPMISCIAVNVVNRIHQARKSLNDYLLQEDAIKKLEHQALAEMEYQRNCFHDMVQEDFHHWDKTMTESFQQILCNSFDKEFNLEKMIGGLDRILSLFGEEARFHSVSEWEEQLDLPLELNF